MKFLAIAFFAAALVLCSTVDVFADPHGVGVGVGRAGFGRGGFGRGLGFRGVGVGVYPGVGLGGYGVGVGLNRGFYGAGVGAYGVNRGIGAYGVGVGVDPCLPPPAALQQSSYSRQTLTQRSFSFGAGY